VQKPCEGFSEGLRALAGNLLKTRFRVFRTEN
jgi:hypothetical protein